MVFLSVASGINLCFNTAKRLNLKKMALYSDLPVYKSTYDLLVAIFSFTKNFYKQYKYTVGENLKKETIGLLTFASLFFLPIV